MSTSNIALRDASENPSKNNSPRAALEPHLVDLSSAQAWKAARALRLPQNTELSAQLIPPLAVSAHHENARPASKTVPHLELPLLSAAQLKAVANHRVKPDTAADWDTKHAALVAKAAHTNAKLQFFGDSITEFIGDGNMDAFERNFGSLKPANFGIAGDTTEGLLKRVNDGELGGHPKALVLLIGTNDVAHGRNPDDIAKDIAKIVKTVRLHEPETKILLMGLLPRCAPNDANRPDMLRKIATVNAEISQLDNGNTIRFVDISSKFQNARGQARQDLLPDYLHPNNAGYQVWSDAIAPILKKMTR